MRNLWFLIPCTVLLFCALSLLDCGSSNRIQSVSVSPATARSHAQFTATGSYADGSKVTQLAALWSQNSPWLKNPIADEIRVDTNGMAECLAVAGTFTIQATVPVDPHLRLSEIGPTTPQVYGTAQLNCP